MASKEEYEEKKKDFENLIHPIFAKFQQGGQMPPGGFPGAGFPGAPPAGPAGPPAGPSVDDLD